MHCCDHMRHHTSRMCEDHDNPFGCPDYVIFYSRTFDEYGLIIHDGGQASYPIHFCPFCGFKLPASKRDQWFKELHKLGFKDPLGDDSIPEAYQSDAWWRGAEKG